LVEPFPQLTFVATAAGIRGLFGDEDFCNCMGCMKKIAIHRLKKLISRAEAG
jgi:hypothetical protein